MAAGLAGCNSAGGTVSSNGGASSLPRPADDSAVLGATSTQGRCLTTLDADVLARQVLTLVNIERASLGLDPLTVDGRLTKAAGDFACTLAADGFFDHIDPQTGEGPGDRAAAAGYDFFAVGENLAAGQPTAAEAVDGWLHSEGHRQNMLSPEWKETGISVRRGGPYNIYWVQLFGSPVTVSPRYTIDEGALTVSR
ncbi:MAG: CAP domain-containing protein [Phycisphaerae bacterium]